ncbi:MAG: hypothetical protein M1457_14350 [bacterium]|nr:hypothetical protein [bacterium]
MRPGRRNYFALIVIFVLILLGPIFRPGIPLSDAHPSRLSEIRSLYERCFGQQHWISGWEQRFLGGYPAGTYQYQTGFWLICGLHRIGLPLVTAYKLVFAAAMVFMAAMAARLLRPHAGEALAAAVALLFFLSPAILNQIAQAFWNHVFALGILCIFLARLGKRETLRGSDALVLAALYAIIILTHLYAAVAAAIFLFCWLLEPVWRRNWAGAARAIAVPPAALLLTYAYSGPILETRHWLAPVEPMELTAREFTGLLLNICGLDAINPYFGRGPAEIAVRLVAHWPVLAAVALALGLVVPWRRGRLTPRTLRFCRWMAVSFACFFVIYVKIAALLPPSRLREMMGSIATARFLQYAHLCLFALAAVSLRHWLGFLSARRERAPAKTAIRAPRPVAWVIGALLILTLAKTSYTLYGNGRLDTESTCPAMTDLRAAWSWLRMYDDVRHRVLYENSFGNYPAAAPGGVVMRNSTIPALAAFETGVPQVGGLLNIVLPLHAVTRSEGGWLAGFPLRNLKSSDLHAVLQSLNIGRIVSCSPEAHARLAADSRMTERARFGAFEIWDFSGAPGNWAAVGGGEPVSFAIDPVNDARMSVRLDNKTPDNPLLIRVCWHPYWEASLNGRPLALRADPLGLIETRVASQGPARIELHYRARRPGFLTVSLTAWGLWLGIWLTVRRRSRRRSAGGAHAFRRLSAAPVTEPVCHPRRDSIQDTIA